MKNIESKDKFLLIMENANDLIAIFNSKFEYEYINEAPHEMILGYSREDLIGESPIKFLHPNDSESVFNNYKNVFETGKGEGKIRFKRNDGTYIWVESKGRTFIDNDRKKKTIIVSRDITERMKAEKIMKESEKKFRLITENANDLIAIFNSKFEYEYINEKPHKHILGYKIKDLIGNSFADFIYDDDLKNPINSYKFEIENKGKELRFKRNDGNYVWLEVKGRTFVTTSGELKAILILREITSRKEAEALIQESEEKFRTISDQALFGISILQDGFLIYVNEAISKISEYSIQEMLQWSPEEIKRKIYPKDSFIFKQKIDKKRRDKGNLNNTIRIITKSGEIKCVEYHSKPILIKGKSALLITLIDITKKKQTEHQLNEYRQYLEKMIQDRTKDLVISNKKLEVEIKNRKTAEEEIRKFKIMADNANYGVAMIDVNMNFIYLNNYFAKVHGYKRYELIGKRFATIHVGEREAENLEFYKKIIEFESYGPSEIWHKHKKGYIFPMLINSLSVKDESGKPFFYAINAIDITHLKNIENKLRASEEKFKSITDLSQDLIFRADIEGRITFANPASAKFFEKHSNKLIGVHFTQYIHPEDIKKAENALKNIILNGVPKKDFKIRLKTPKGIRIVKFHGSLIKNDNNNIIGVQATGRDVTELQNEILEKNKLAAVGQLAAGIAHQLNTPLANIILKVDYIANSMCNIKPLANSQILLNEISAIKDQAKFCAEIVKNLLQFSRKMNLNLKNLNLGALLTEIIALPVISSKLKERGIKFIIENKENIIINADKLLFIQVFQNLITNAIDALEDVKYKPMIKINILRLNEEVRIKIIDNGNGIKTSDLPRIFEPFFSTKTIGKGTGLGLSICRGIIEKHGGKINVESSYGKGTEVIITLPFKIPN